MQRPRLPLTDNDVILTVDQQYGRHLRAARDLHPADLALDAQPWAAVPSDPMAPYCCHQCLKRTQQAMYLCSGCQFSQFCSMQCLNAAKTTHQGECGFLAAIAAQNVRVEDSTPLRLLVRILAYKMNEEAITAKLYRSKIRSNKVLFQDLLELVTHREHFPDDTLREVEELIVNVQAYLPDSGVTLDQAVDLMLILQCNAHAITAVDRTVIGMGLYPQACYFNHSCRPNMVFSFSEPHGSSPPSIDFRVIEDIKAGDQLCYSYVDLYQTTEGRNAIIERAYFFRCTCERCKTKSGDTVIGGYKCDSCHELLQDTKCPNSCKELDLARLQSNLEATQSVLQVAAQSAQNDPEHALHVLTQGILSFLSEDKSEEGEDDEGVVSFSATLNPHHVLMFNAYILGSQCARQLGRRELELKLLNLAVEAMHQDLGFDIQYHPDLATLYEGIADVYLSQGDNEKSFEYMHKSLIIRNVSLGRDAALTVNTKRRIDEFSSKVSAKKSKKKVKSNNKRSKKKKKKGKR